MIRFNDIVAIFLCTGCFAYTIDYIFLESMLYTRSGAMACHSRGGATMHLNMKSPDKIVAIATWHTKKNKDGGRRRTGTEVTTE